MTFYSVGFFVMICYQVISPTAIIPKGVTLKVQLSFHRVGIFALLFPMLFLPMLHLHPAYDHVHGAVEGHQHQPAVHADFFPSAAHGHEHHDDHDQHMGDAYVSMDTSDVLLHALHQIDLLSLHIGQSFQFSSVFKKNPLAFTQGAIDLFIVPHLNRRGPNHQHAPPPQTVKFPSFSLRAPPFFA